MDADVEPVDQTMLAYDFGDDDPFIGAGSDYDMDGAHIRGGGGYCGSGRFELRGEPLKVGLCHCTECRKATGLPRLRGLATGGLQFQRRGAQLQRAQLLSGLRIAAFPPV